MAEDALAKARAIAARLSAVASGEGAQPLQPLIFACSRCAPRLLRCLWDGRGCGCAGGVSAALRVLLLFVLRCAALCLLLLRISEADSWAGDAPQARSSESGRVAGM